METSSLFKNDLTWILGMIISWIGFGFISYFIFKRKPNRGIKDAVSPITIILCGPSVLFVYLICDKQPD